MKRAGGLIIAVTVFAAACGSDSEGGGSGGSGATGGSGGVGGSGGSGGSGATGAVTGGGSGGVAGSSGSGGIAGGGGSGGAPIVRVNTCVGPSGAALSNAKLPPGYCAWTWADNVSQARGIKVDTDGNVLVVARGGNNVVALWDDDKDGVSGASERMTVAQAPNLNHGIVLHKGYLWASSSSTVYRWAYTPRQDLGSSTSMITGIPASGHATRTLLFDANDYLYVTVGSAGNVDADSSRARVIRYKLSDLEAGPKTFGDGELFADGTRNEVGIALDPSGRVWGVENGVDNLSRSDLGGDIHNENPGEELNLFDTPGKFHGYPYCWSEHSLGAQYAKGAGTQWAHPNFMSDGTHTDAWCQNPQNVVPPALSMQAHTAPLDILFYPGGSFPADTVGDAFITFHGSWNASPAVGRSVVRVPFGANGMPSGSEVPILETSGSNVNNFPHRPVGLAVSKQGMLYVTSDSTDRVIAIGHDGT